MFFFCRTFVIKTNFFSPFLARTVCLPNRGSNYWIARPQTKPARRSSASIRVWKPRGDYTVANLTLNADYCYYYYRYYYPVCSNKLLKTTKLHGGQSLRTWPSINGFRVCLWNVVACVQPETRPILDNYCCMNYSYGCRRVSR